MGREFVPRAEVLSFASPKESTQRKGDPTFAPSACGYGFPVLLGSRGGCGTRAGLTGQHSNSPRRLPRAFLRCSALSTGAGSWWRQPPCYLQRFFGGQQAAHPTQAGQAWLLAFPRISPVGHAEHRRSARGSRRGLLEWLQAASSAAAARFEKHRATRSAAEGVTFGSPSLGYLSWRDKKGNVPAGHPRHLNQLRVSAQHQTAASLQTAPSLPHSPACKPIPVCPAGPPR